MKPWEIKKLTWDREKSSETLWHTVKPWELRSLVLLFFLQRIVYGHQRKMCSVQVFCKKVLLKISTIFTGMYLRWSLFWMKLQGLQYRWKEIPTQVFSCEYCGIFKNSLFIAHLRWLLLNFYTGSQNETVF